MVTTRRRSGNYKKLNISPGDRFGNLTVIGETHRFIQPSGQACRAMLCLCDCSNTKVVRVAHLTRGRIKSCGCLVGEQHGMSYSKLYRVWTGMHVRCYQDTCIDHHRYKDRGIVMCDEWRNSFTAFKEWALANGYQEGLQIDRENNDAGYNPSNCRFVTPDVNVNNRSVTLKVLYDGMLQPYSSFIKRKGLQKRYSQILQRIKRGWLPQEAIDTPMRKGNYRRKHGIQGTVLQ